MIVNRMAVRIAFLVAAVLVVPALASADIVASLEPSAQTLMVGDSGFLDVFVTGTTTAGDSVQGYTITLAPTSGLSYTGVNTTPTTAPDGYIFPDSGGLLVDRTTPDVSYNDFSAGAPTSVSTADTYGAGRIFFDAISPGTFTINFEPSQSGFFRSDLSPITTSFTGATVTVLPEPSTTLLLILTGMTGLVVTRIRRKKPAGAKAA